MSFLNLVLGASPVVQFVMLILVIASVLSWALIIGKGRQLRKARGMADDFEQEFWGSADISGTYSRLANRRGSLSGMERVFEAGFSEFGRLRRKTENDEVIMDGSSRAMRIAVSRETDIVEGVTPVGGGSLPGAEMPSVSVVVRTASASELALRLRTGSPRVFPRISEGSLFVDLRSVKESDLGDLQSAILAALS